MRILISNDDSVNANGIKFLFEELKKDNNPTIIAPNRERSSCGHGISLGEPLRLTKVKDNVYSCSGTPADCILVGIGQVFKDNKPDLVVSGINHGANLGQDRYYSGTIAAAREASFRGIPAIAVSLVTKNIKDLEHFETAASFVAKLVKNNIHEIIPEFSVLNINVPNLPEEKVAGVKITFAGFQQYSEEVVERIDTRGRSYYWVGGTYDGHKDIAGSDCNVVNDGFISLNLQSMNGLNLDNFKPLEELIAKLE